MNINILKNKTGHWQDMIKLSPVGKAWRRDLNTGMIFSIDKKGYGVYFDLGQIPQKAKLENLMGFSDWKPVIT